MLRYILSCKGIDPAAHGLGEQDILFIEEMIAGTAEEERRGRPCNKAYLYGMCIFVLSLIFVDGVLTSVFGHVDIVNNTRSGLDVDKIDYFEV